MLKSLKNLGVNVRLLCLTQGEALEEEIRSIGIPITFVGSSPAKLIRLYQIIKELRRNRPQIVQSAHFYTNLYAAVAGRVLGIKSIGAIRNDLFSEIKANGVLGKAQLNQPDHLIANTALAQSRARAKGVTNVHVLPNVTAVNGLRAQAGDANEAVFQILFAGRLTEQKRADCFLRSLRQLADTRPDLEFKGIVAGDGPLRARLEGLADQLSLRPRYCEFLGEVGDLKSLYLKSDVLLLTSEWEGSPNVVLEAMSAGLPVVATRVGGVPELVQDGENGFLTQSEDVDSIVRSLIRLSENAALRNSMGMAGREKVLQRHTAERLGERLLKMYRTLVSDRGEDPAPAAMFNTNGRQMRNSSTSGEIEVV
jgi:glycosyltransferase involved in cell wall biosynthesis